jgi:dienelactone hydrolase
MRRTITLVPVFALMLASCGSGTDEGQDAQPTGTPQASASASALTASPTPEIRTDYDIPPWREIVAMYEYDTSEPLGFKELSEDPEDGATVYDVTYQSSGYAVPAYLVIPDGRGPFPAVLYVHGSGVDRRMHLAEAVALAGEGYAGLAINGPARRQPYAKFYSGQAADDIEGHVQYVTDLRRGIDLLGTLPEVDASRIGLVGLSLGCQEGGILSGLEDRIDAYVLMSCGGYATDPRWLELAWMTEKEMTRYQDQVAVLNPVNYVIHNQGAAFLIQASETDAFASVENVQALFAAAPKPKELKWYTLSDTWGGHALGCPYSGSPCNPELPAYAFHLDWLQDNV